MRAEHERVRLREKGERQWEMEGERGGKEKGIVKDKTQTGRQTLIQRRHIVARSN